MLKSFRVRITTKEAGEEIGLAPQGIEHDAPYRYVIVIAGDEEKLQPAALIAPSRSPFNQIHRDISHTKKLSSLFLFLFFIF